jgi:lipopolysaccharide/colanic/teichoic acid biosynthesis glycosyltransferase|tara:strand:- start:334 stop:1065 length:732 start_codon:yes stop_codon:yes gene_type:complete
LLKSSFDFLLSLILSIILFPVVILFSFLIWRDDHSSPFYVAPRVGKEGKIFKMIKFRSMMIEADKSGVDSTAINDPRITNTGHFIRQYKIDEIPNLYNIIMGQMSFVGPRPNVKKETDMYTIEEKKLLLLKPGITDLASIIFSDEGEILSESNNPDLDYNQLIRPWKSRLGLFYVENYSFVMDLKIMIITLISLFSKKGASKLVYQVVSKKSGDKNLLNIILRKNKLRPFPPPGSNKIVLIRE